MSSKKKVLIVTVIVISIVAFLIIKLFENESNKNLVQNVVGSSEYKKMKNGYEFHIEGMSEDAIRKVEIIEDFENKLKDYCFERDFIDYGGAYIRLVDEKQAGDIYYLKFQVEDYTKINIVAEINLKDKTYEFYAYK